MAFKPITTLREMFTEALNETGESWVDVVGQNVTMERNAEVRYNPFHDKGNNTYSMDTRLKDISKDEWFDLRFDWGYGSSVPIRVILWTKNNIHFNYEYDGFDFVITKPRNPPNEGD